MARKDVYTDPDRPPQVGPYATREWADGRWRVRLTPAGSAELAAWLLVWPRPGKLFWTAWPGMRAAVRAARIGRRELHAVCLQAAAKAMTKFDPALPGAAAFGTYAAWWMRALVGKEIGRRYTPRRYGVRVLSGHAPLRSPKGDGDACQLDFAVAHADQRFDPQSRDRAIVLRRQVPSWRYREIFALRHGLHDGRPMTLDEVGEVLGVSRERVRQIEGKVLRKIGPELLAAYRDHCGGDADA